MKLTGIEIDRYGHYEQLHIPGEALSRAVTVIYGPNETGKSTLHSFIRFVLFGFTERGSNPYQPLKGGHIGGALHVEHEGRSVRVSRHTPPKKGQVTVHIDGQLGTEHELRALLGHISPVLFEAIFAFSHQELGRLETLQADEINSYLYSAAMGSRGIDLLQLEQTLSKRREEWFRPRATKPKINQLLYELEQEEKEIQTLKNRMKNYVPLKEKVEQREGELEGLRQERKRLERKQRELENLKRAKQLQEEIKHLRIQIEQLPPFRFLPYEQRFHALLMQKVVMTEKKEEMERLKAQLAEKTHQLRQRIEILGPEWSLTRITKYHLSLDLQDQLLGLASQITELESERREVGTRREEQELKVKQLTAVWELEKEALQQQLQQHRQQDEAEQETLSSKGWLAGCFIALGLALVILFVSGSPLVALITLAGLVITLFLGYQLHKQRDNLTQSKLVALKEQLEQIYSHSDRYLKQMEHELILAKDQLSYLKEKEAELNHLLHHWQEEWTNKLTRLGWPASLSAHRAPELLRLLAEIQQEQGQVEQIKERLKQLEEAVAAWEEEVSKLAQEVDGDGAGDVSSGGNIPPAVWLEMMDARIAQEKEQARKKEKLLFNLKQCQLQYEQIALSLNISEQQLNEQLQTLSAQQIQEFLSGVERELEVNLKQIEMLATEIGHLQSELREMETEESLARKVQSFEQKKTRLNQMAKEWAVLSLAGRLCRETRQMYEEKRQPAVLKEAGRFFSKMTLGRYIRIIAPLGQKELIAVRQDGERLPVSFLSQGAKEQLYLALRFAFIREFSRHVNLPVMMDDPFVNCDHKRLEAILQGVQELASTHQVILFTCHDHIVRCVRQMFTETGEIELPFAFR
ncbi:hypothetical protein GCM10010965_29470 [Caldalkalibacillus thermarum]|uniref:ATP-binding protein n=1 Tax=Caldalkalibacillus thermarum TaxID=296745 RepID=UPI00166ECF14|nr:AAA family ATPase [Caldalkalibacillus thermarum]GGK34601.1 hypothetical protein GCM10010965_29470 [Caldalkalibacillus thermarum]